MNDIISVIVLLTLYIIGIAVIVSTFTDTGRTANQRKYEKTERSDLIWEIKK